MSWFRKRMPDAVPPEGVVIVRCDGSVIGCDVIRDEDQDAGGCACWVAVPREGFIFDPDEDRIHVGFLPLMTDLIFGLPLEEE